MSINAHVEEFLSRSFQDILEMGRELFSYANDPTRDDCLNSMGEKIDRIKKDSGRLNFKKMEEISHLLENIFYHVGIKKISADEKFTSICLRANNLYCDILKSIESSGCEKSEHYKSIIGDMMTYLEYGALGEHLVKDTEFLNIPVERVENYECESTVENIEDSPAPETMFVLIVESGGINFCINHKCVIFIDKLEKKSIEYIRNMEFYRWKGEALPLVRLNQFFGLQESDHGNEHVVIVKEGEKRFAIVLDKILNNQKIVVEPLDADIYQGATIMGEGNIGFILNIVQLYQENFHGKRIAFSKKLASSEDAAKESSRDERVLIFDINDKNYGIPIGLVERIEKFMKGNVEWSGEQAIVRYQEKVLPIINFGLSDVNNGEEACCVVVNVDGNRKGFFVNNVLDVSSYREKKKENFNESKGIMETTHIGERFVQIINPAVFLNKSCFQWLKEV